MSWVWPRKKKFHHPHHMIITWKNVTAERKWRTTFLTVKKTSVIVRKHLLCQCQKKQFFHCRENPIVSVWQCRATMNILSSPNNSKTSILDFPPPNAKCDKKSKTLIALRAMQQLIFNQTFTARLYCSFLFSCSWNCHVPECWRGAPCHHDHAHHDHDQSWLIMTNNDQSWPIMTHHDQSWPSDTS